MNSEEECFPYAFQIVGDLGVKSSMIERLIEEIGILDTKNIPSDRKRKVEEFINKCFLYRLHNDITYFDYSEITDKINKDIPVSGKWTIIPSNSTKNDINVTMVCFREKDLMEKYFTYSLLGNEYTKLE